jgi:hypothetical protein
MRSFNFQLQNWPSNTKKKKGRKDSDKKEKGKINNILYEEQKYLGEG